MQQKLNEFLDAYQNLAVIFAGDSSKKRVKLALSRIARSALQERPKAVNFAHSSRCFAWGHCCCCKRKRKNKGNKEKKTNLSSSPLQTSPLRRLLPSSLVSC